MNGFVFDSTEYPVISKNLFDEPENVRKNVKEYFTVRLKQIYKKQVK